MLTQIRNRATGWIAWAIVILISIPFALWGVNSYFTGGVNVNVAEFDGEEIDYQSYQRALFSERERLRQSLGDNASAEMLSGAVLGRQVVERLVNDILLQREAFERGYRISDEQLADTIRDEPRFHDDSGSFSRPLYERILQFSGYSPSEFENIQRLSAATQQLQTGFVESVISIDSSVENLVQLMNQKRVGEYAIVEPSAFLSDIQVSEEEILAEYEENQNLYIDDEKIIVDYIELSRSDFAVNYTPTDETLREIYDAQAEQYREEERRSVSHILLDFEEDPEDLVWEQANELVKRIRDGSSTLESFAKDFSDDVGSASAGGSIGWINRGVTVPAFENVAFSQEVGEISEPFESEFGVHIVRVDEIQAETIKQFEEVRSELVEQAVSSQAETEMFEIAEEIRNIAFEQPDSLEPAADLLGTTIKESDWFSRTQGTGIAADERIRQAAFSDTVLEDEFNSDVIALDDGRQVLLRKRDYRPSETLSLSLVEAEITEKLLAEKGAAKVEEYASNLLERLADGASWQETMEQEGLETQAIPERIGPLNDADGRSVARIVYDWAKPSENSSAFGGDSIGNGRYAIFEITDVIDGDSSSNPEQEVENLHSILNSRFGFGLFESYVNHLLDGVDVSINEELL